MKEFTIGKLLRFVDGCYNDCINRWEIKRAAKRIFPYGTEMRKLKVTYLGKQGLGCLKLPHNVYKVISAEGVCKFIGMYYNDHEGGDYYELEEV